MHNEEYGVKEIHFQIGSSERTVTLSDCVASYVCLAAGGGGTACTFGTAGAYTATTTQTTQTVSFTTAVVPYLALCELSISSGATQPTAASNIHVFAGFTNMAMSCAYTSWATSTTATTTYTPVEFTSHQYYFSAPHTVYCIFRVSASEAITF